MNWRMILGWLTSLIMALEHRWTDNSSPLGNRYGGSTTVTGNGEEEEDDWGVVTTSKGQGEGDRDDEDEHEAMAVSHRSALSSMTLAKDREATVH